MRTRRVGAVGAAALGWVLASAPDGRADPLPTSAEHVASPGRSVASDDTGDALVLNPANLAWLPGPELRWTWVNCPDDAMKVGCGHAWEAATPLPFDLATALRVDLVQPPWGAVASEGVGFPYRGSDYVWLTWGLALKIFDQAVVRRVARALVLAERLRRRALRRQRGPHVPAEHALWLRGGGAGLQPAEPGARSSVLADVARAEPVLDGRYALAMSLRPTGRRDIDLGFEAPVLSGVQPVGAPGDARRRRPGRRARVRERRVREPAERFTARRARDGGARDPFRGAGRGRRRALRQRPRELRGRVRDRFDRGIHAAGTSLPGARRVDSHREHAVHARARRAPAALVATGRARGTWPP